MARAAVNKWFSDRKHGGGSTRHISHLSAVSDNMQTRESSTCLRHGACTYMERKVM
jgi:hypothetical protein